MYIDPGKMHFVLHLDVHRAQLDVLYSTSSRTSVERESPRKNHAIDFPITTMSEMFRRVPLVVTPSLLPETADTLPDSATKALTKESFRNGQPAKRPKANDINDSEAINLASCSDDELNIEGNDDVRHKF